MFHILKNQEDKIVKLGNSNTISKQNFGLPENVFKLNNKLINMSMSNIYFLSHSLCGL